MPRELGIALRAGITWLVAALSALLIGHGFVLAVDLYSASSRSALASTLQMREMDPLAGIVRPTLGGLDLAISLLVPLVAARVLSIEKERRTLGALCLLEGGSGRVVLKKLVAALAATALAFAAPIILFVVVQATGAHVDGIESGVALAGEGLHALLVASVSLAASAWTRTFAQAASLGIVISLSSWAIDAAEGFAALSWLGGAAGWSIERQLEPFQRGVVSIGSIVWLLAASVGATILALIGGRFDMPSSRRAAAAVVTVGVTTAVLFDAGRSHRAYDWTEQRRASLPLRVVDALHRIEKPMQLDVFLDRDDSRRRQMESDVLSKLYLARPDLTVRTPLDERRQVAEGQHDLDYGKIVIHVGSSAAETRSTSRREIVTLILETAGVPIPNWDSTPYRGFPFVAQGYRRAVLALFAYFVVPLGFLMGALITRRRFIQ